MRKLNYGQIDAENPGTTQGKKVPGALETLTGLENLQVTDTGGGIWRSVSHISWSKNSVLSLATAHSVSVYLFFQQRCAQSPCSGSQRSQKPQQGTTALGELGLRSGGGGDLQRAQREVHVPGQRVRVGRGLESIYHQHFVSQRRKWWPGG